MSNNQKPVYLLVQLNVRDMPVFMEEYVKPLQPINQRYGVELLAGTPNVSVIEGSYDKDIAVILRFPSAEVQAEWYADQEYQPLLKRRRELTNTDTSVVLLMSN